MDKQQNRTVGNFSEYLANQQKKQLGAETKIKDPQKSNLTSDYSILESILSGITDIVLLIFPEQHSISVISENPGNFDLQKQNLIQQTIEQFSLPETSQTFFAQAQQAIEHQQRINFEYSISLPNQDQFLFSAQISPLPNNTAIWISRDITHRKSPSTEYAITPKTNHLELVVEDQTKVPNLSPTSIDLEQEKDHRSGKLAIAYANLKQEMVEDVALKKALVDSEKKFRAIFEQAGVGIAVTGLDKKLLQVNPKFCQFVGYTATELKSVTFEQITHPDERPADSIHIEQLRNNQRTTLIKEKRYIHQDGSVIWGKITVAVVNDSEEKPQYFIAVIEDITQRKRAELDLQESEARFISLLNTCPFLIRTLGNDGLCNFVNTAWLDLTGRTLEQELGNGWTAGVHPADLDFCLSTYNRACSGQKGFKVEYRLRRHDGEYAWVYDEGIPKFKADGSFGGYICTCVDISDHIKAKQEREQLLQQVDQERQFLKTVLQQMPAGVMIGEPPFGNIILSNDRVESILRHSLKPITSLEDYKQFSCLQDDGKPLPLEDYCMLRAFRGEEYSNKEFNYLCGDGSMRILVFSVAPVRNHQQKIIAGVITLHDVTEQKQAQAAKKEAENKSILLKEIHHRIKNNLQIVSSLLDLQSEQIQDPAAIVLLEKSQARIHTMALIHEKLYTSKNLERIDFVEYVNSLIKHLHDSFIPESKQVNLTLDMEQIYLDLDLAIPCGLIINELVVNSLEHAFLNQLSGEIKVSFHKHADKYHLTIQDNGSGNAQEIAKIIENTQFLGLSLVNSLVKYQLKGILQFKQNNGFVIQITLPVI